MRKILIADDNKQITTILSSYAKKECLEPIIALDGAEAIEKFSQQEQKAEVEAFIKADMAQRQARHEKLQNMTPEQRQAIRANRPLKMHDGKHPALSRCQRQERHGSPQL